MGSSPCTIPTLVLALIATLHGSLATEIFHLSRPHKLLQPRQMMHVGISSEPRKRSQLRLSLEKRRTLLPERSRIISDTYQQVLSHVVRISSPGNGVGTGLLLKKDYVLTTRRVVQRFVYPWEFRVELGFLSAVGQNVSIHPEEDLAVIRISPPIVGTGREPVLGSPRGLFWPISNQSPPLLGSQVELYGYGGPGGLGTQNKYLKCDVFPILELSQDQILVSINSSFPTTGEDSGGPGFLKNGTILIAVLQYSLSDRGVLLSAAAYREWIFDAIKSPCDLTNFNRLLELPLGNSSSESPLCYYCEVERAESLGVYLSSTPECDNSTWKAVVITDGLGKPVAMVETRSFMEQGAAMLKQQDFGWSGHFFIEVWREDNFHLRNVSRIGPFKLHDFMDGGLHFEWCATLP